MFLERIPKLGQKLAVRLTFWYAAIFAASATVAFAFAYALIVGVVAERSDNDLREDISEFSVLLQQEGVGRVSAEMALDTQGEQAEKAFFRLWTSTGRLLATTDMSNWSELVRVPHQALRDSEAAGSPVLDTLKLPSREDRVRTIIGTVAPGVVLEIGQSLEEDEEFVAKIARGFLLTLVIVLFCGGPIGWFMARRALLGVKEVTRTANEIADGALDRRVPVGPRGDELDELASTVNTMLDRIQKLIVGMREMADNLAHDLKSPLARIRTCAEMTLLSSERNGSRESLATSTIEECDRLLEMINTTLDIAEAESGAARLNVSRVDIAEIVRSACELFQTVAEDGDIRLVSSIATDCYIQGDRQKLQRAIANLLDNAIKYTRAGGEVRIDLRAQGESVSLTIEDTGVGISSDELPRIFQRFYRCDRSRSQQGIGLGLSLARAFVRAHAGDITASSTEGVGSTFSIVLPRPLSGPTVAQRRFDHRPGMAIEVARET